MAEQKAMTAGRALLLAVGLVLGLTAAAIAMMLWTGDKSAPAVLLLGFVAGDRFSGWLTGRMR